LTETEFGECALGQYGTAKFYSEDFQYIQCWYLSNGKDFIYAEYHNYLIPEDEELQELHQIVKGLELAEEIKQRSKWH
jgi:hypothetical protein